MHKKRLYGKYPITYATNDSSSSNISKQLAAFEKLYINVFVYQGNEERIAKLLQDVARLTADLQAEQDLARRADAGRRQLETDLRDANNRLKVAEQALEDAEKDSIRKINNIEARLKEAEMIAESESKRVRELTVHLR